MPIMWRARLFPQMGFRQNRGTLGGFGAGEPMDETSLNSNKDAKSDVGDSLSRREANVASRGSLTACPENS